MHPEQPRQRGGGVQGERGGLAAKRRMSRCVATIGSNFVALSIYAPAPFIPSPSPNRLKRFPAGWGLRNGNFKTRQRGRVPDAAARGLDPSQGLGGLEALAAALAALASFTEAEEGD